MLKVGAIWIAREESILINNCLKKVEEDWHIFSKEYLASKLPAHFLKNLNSFKIDWFLYSFIP